MPAPTSPRTEPVPHETRSSGTRSYVSQAALIARPNLSWAWLDALDRLVTQGGKAVNLTVVMPGDGGEDPGIRGALDGFIAANPSAAQPVETVAGTLFPNDLYFPHLGERAAPHLYATYREAYPFLRQHPGNVHGTYFGRLVAWERPGDEPLNQLERVVERLRRELRGRGPKSSAYELSVVPAGGWDTELRVQRPDDTRLMGFPCLSHISLKLVDGQLHLCALYRNQFFIQRAYGNYLGLVRLLGFICHEVGCAPGEMLCLATHADAERLGQARALVREARTAQTLTDGEDAGG
ncbi:hypothetical protein [Deinococcus aestuarii]|uniref:hypothetical protein n=1 Tax=Deinococcus aestuarii TaxID=2774531 RepID=UPI001C0DCE84|nr:hypothetical protein [Deinococcus aestuarii]